MSCSTASLRSRAHPRVERCYFSTLEKQGGSYVTGDLREREDDIIWRVRVARVIRPVPQPLFRRRALIWVGRSGQTFLTGRMPRPALGDHKHIGDQECALTFTSMPQILSDGADAPSGIGGGVPAKV